MQRLPRLYFSPTTIKTHLASLSRAAVTNHNCHPRLKQTLAPGQGGCGPAS